jgi:L-2-hydroxyglutarate oxidase LhgO
VGADVTDAAPVGIVGAGIVGLAVARQLALAGVPVVVFEKEPAVAAHQTGHNSGVVHAGIYYAPGSAKAAMTRRGVGLLRGYCADHGLAWDERGKLVIARDHGETGRLRELERRAAVNGVPGVRWLSAGELRALEPEVAGVAALLSPTTAIVDYPAIARSFAADVAAAGGEVLTSVPVTGVRPRPGGGAEADTPGGPRRLSRLVNCAGLQADLIARQAGDTPAPQIVPFRGEYLRLRPQAASRVRHLIYPVPDPRYPFLGVHLTPRVDGTSDLGPNAVLALAREGYRRTDVSAGELARLAGSAAFRRLARQHWRTGVREYRGSLFRRAYLAEARTYLPWLSPGDVTAAPAGVRAQAVGADGTLVDDFVIARVGDVISVRNAPSPAATASLAIAEHIVAALGLPSLGRPAAAPAGDGQAELGHQPVGELAAGRVLGRRSLTVHPGQHYRQRTAAHLHPRARRQVEPAPPVAPQDRLPVLGAALVHELHRQDRARRDHQGPGEQRVRGDRHHQQRLHPGPDHGTAGRERVRGRPGRGGADHAVAAPARQRPAVHLDDDLDHPLPGGLLHAGLVQRPAPDHLGAVVAGDDVERHPLLDPVVAVDQAVDRLGEPVGLGLGQEAHVAEVHADERGARRADEPRGAQQRPVAAEHDDQLGALGRGGRGGHHGSAGAGESGRLRLRHPHPDAGRKQPVDDLLSAANRGCPAGVREHQHRSL